MLNLGVGLGVGLVLAAAPVQAHHSIAAEFDVTKPVSFTGTVKRVDWMNPHIYVQIETKDASGKPVLYKVEGGPPNALFRAGWTPDSLKVGDTVTVTGVRAKSAQSTNVGQATITKDGKKIYTRGGNPEYQQ